MIDSTIDIAAAIEHPEQFVTEAPERRAERCWQGGYPVRWPLENMPNGWAVLRENDRVNRHYYVDGRKADRSVA